MRAGGDHLRCQQLSVATYVDTCERLSGLCDAEQGATGATTGWTNFTLPVPADTGVTLPAISNASDCLQAAVDIPANYGFVTSDATDRARTLIAKPHAAAPLSVAAKPAPSSPVRLQPTFAAGFCTKDLGYVATADGYDLHREFGVPVLTRHGVEILRGEPVLRHEPGGHDIIAMPYRETLFEFDSALPQNPGTFRDTIHGMVDDIGSVTTGPFAHNCLDLNPQFRDEVKVYFPGWTDTSGDQSYNLSLADERTMAVAAANQTELAGRRGRLKTTTGMSFFAAGMGEVDGPDNVKDPRNRRVEMYVTTGDPPFAGHWRRVDTIAATNSAASFSLADFCSTRPAGCVALLGQCTSAVTYMCGDVYRDDPAQARACTTELSATNWGVGDPLLERFAALKEWLERGYYQFKLMHSSGAVATANSKRQCTITGDQLLTTNGPYQPPEYSPIDRYAVINRQATRATIDPGTKFCTEGLTQFVPADRCIVTDTPHGRELDCGSDHAVFDQQWIVASIGHHILRFNHPWRILRSIDANDVAQFKQQLITDIEDASNSRGFFKACAADVLRLNPIVRFDVDIAAHDASHDMIQLAQEIVARVATRHAQPGMIPVVVYSVNGDLPPGTVGIKVMPAWNRGAADPGSPISAGGQRTSEGNAASGTVEIETKR